MGEDQTNEATETENEIKEIHINKYGINTKLVMLKITLFFLYGATSSLVPYLTIHMQSIGLTMEEIALIYLSLPFTTFLAPIITGFLVDKFGRYKPVVIVCFLLTAVLHHSLLLIPHQETPGQVPSGYIITHPRKLYVEVWWSPCPSRECPEQEEIDVVLEMCVDHCLLNNPKKPLKPTPNITVDPGSDDDLFFHLGKNKNKTAKLTFTLDMHENLGEPVEQLGIDVDSPEEEDNVMDFKKRFHERLLKRFKVNVTELDERDLRCGGIVLQANSSTRDRLKGYSTDCILQKCKFRSGGPEICPPDYKESDDKTFWIYFLLRFVGTIMLTGGVTIMDPIALAMIEKYGGDFGKERLFSSLGMAIFSPITGAFIDYNSNRLGYTDYSAAFYTFDALLLISALAIVKMPLGTKLPADNMFRDLWNIIKMPQLLVFIGFLFILGNLWGFIESFLFFYLIHLGAPNYLLGITVTVGTLSSLPFLYGAENISQKLGHINIIIIAFFAHAARLVGYSVIESAWWCFPFEAMESLSVHLMWVAAATYCALIAPKGLLATVIGVVGMAHFSIGRGSGSFVGGNIIGKFGIRQAFRLMGLVAVISGVFYAMLHYAWLRKLEHVKYDEEEIAENGETSKLKDGEPKYVDKSTMVSFERLSLVIEYNQIGSLTSLGRMNMLRTSNNSVRRLSLTGTRSSTSKMDLRRSTVEVNHSKISPLAKNVSHHLSRQDANSVGKVYDHRSLPKLPQRSGSVAPVERELENSLIPNEKDEIVYDDEISQNKTKDDEKNS